MTPLDALNGFMNSWKNNNWTTMFDYIQITWKSNHPLELLRVWFEVKDLISFQILGIKKISNVCFDFTVKVNYLLRVSTLKESKVTIRIICESDPYEPSIYGKWGVNPSGLIRALNLEERK